MEDDEEPKKSTKEEEIFGIPWSRAGALAGGIALLGLGALAFHVLKPQLPNLQQQPAQQQAVQQQQQQPVYTPEQIQQIQAQQQQAAQQEQQQQTAPQPVAYGYATEHDPMSGKVTRTRVKEIEDTGGSDRFSSISV
jgi:protein-disulfide isomerase